MALLISFRTAKFDVTAETPNPINPIAGESVLNWLREALAKTQYTASEPATEDWGWYIGVDGAGASYLVGASADVEGEPTVVDWIIQVHKHRSFKEKMLGRNKLAADDALFRLIESIVRSDSGISDVSVDQGGQG